MTSRAVSFPFELDFAHPGGKVLDFLSGEALAPSLESLRLEDVEGWPDRSTRSSAVGNLAIGCGMVLSALVLLEGAFSRISPAR